MRLVLTLCLLFPGSCEPPPLLEFAARAVLSQTTAGSVERWRPLVAEHFPAKEVETALCIIDHESGGDPTAANPRSSARGLFQILGSLWGPRYGVSYQDLYEPKLNARLAADIWERSGWWAWSPYRRGACR